MKSTVDALLSFAAEFVRLIGGYAVILAPLLITLAPISIITLMLFRTILVDIPVWVSHFPLRLIICLLIGLGLEIFALACLIVSRHAEEFNLTKETGEPTLNQSIGRKALTAYIVLGLTMVIIGEILPHYEVLQSAQIARYTLLGFFLLAPFGHWLFSTEATIRRLEARRLERQAATEATEDKALARATQELGLQERQAALEVQKAQAEAQRLQAMASLQKQAAAVIRAEARRDKPASAKRQPKPTRPKARMTLDEFLAILGEHANGQFGPAEAMEWSGLARTAVWTKLKRATEAGKVETPKEGVYILHRNGVEG